MYRRGSMNSSVGTLSSALRIPHRWVRKRIWASLSGGVERAAAMSGLVSELDEIDVFVRQQEIDLDLAQGQRS